MAKMRLDDKTVRDLPAPATGNRIDYDVPKGERDRDFVRGFAVRVTAAGTKTFLLVYVTQDGRERRHKVGEFGPFTVTTARDAARKLRILVDAGGDPFAGVKERRAAAVAARAMDGATFGGLLTAYVELLKRRKKPSAAKVEAEIHRTIKWKESKDKKTKTVAEIWTRPASEVALDDLVRIITRLESDGKLRQAEKTRSYLRAAYNAAASARGKAGASEVFENFRHVENVARDLSAVDRPKVEADDAQQGDEKRALSAAALGCYWRRIRAMPGPHGALLRFHLLTGAQRGEQLARLTGASLDREASTITLLDPKGARKKVRHHVVPLLPEALAALDEMKGDAGPYVFTLDGGEHGAGYHTLRQQVLKVAVAMVDAGEVESTFTPGELRITVETRLQAAGVSESIRAHLQSHGLGGIQNRHYAKHNFAEEKRAALVTLRALLEPKGKVVQMRRRRA